MKECKDSNSFYNILEEISYCCTGGDDSAEDEFAILKVEKYYTVNRLSMPRRVISWLVCSW